MFFILGPRGLQCETNLQEIMGRESSDVFRFDLGAPPSRSNEDSQNLKVLITCLLLVLEVCNVKPTYKKSWAGNSVMWSDLTLGPFFKVK